MSLARTYPTLRTRIVQQHWTTIPADTTGVTRPRQAASFTERYRGTEFDSHVTLSSAPETHRDTRGREFVLLWATGLASVIGVIVVALPA